MLMVNGLILPLLFGSMLMTITKITAFPTDPIDTQVLKDLYDAMNGTNWQWNVSSAHPPWNFSQPINETNPCDPIHWQRVMCTVQNGTNRVTTLLLSSFGLSGTLPSSVGNLEEISIFDVAINAISGPIPEEIGSLTKVKILYISTNSLTGSLPESLGNLRLLDDCDVDNNRLTGTIPSSLGLLTTVRYLDMDNNYFTGTIPPEMRTMSKLIDLDLDKNRLTGTIPSALSQLTQLLYLSLDTNRLVGSVPSEIGSMTKLNVLLLQNNRLTGHLNSFLWQASNLSLLSLDLSGNTFSGTIPPSLFTIPQINILSLSVNCFVGPLPVTVCSATTASILAMDSLSSSPSCPHSWHFWLINRIFWRYFGGSYPACVTALPNLVVLHLSGNGLGGKLGIIPPTSKLRNLSLTHNRLTGTIPSSFQEWPFLDLDLSVNRLTGEFLSNVSEAYAQLTCFGDTDTCLPRRGKIATAINRLSGSIPSEIFHAKRVDVLTDNTFACHHLPPHDPVVNYYTCGSTLLDIAMATFGAILVSLLSVALLVTLSSHKVSVAQGSSTPSTTQLWSRVHQIFIESREYVNWNQHLMPYSLPNTQGFNDLLDQFLKGTILLSGLGIFLNLPTYVMKFQEEGVENGDFTTHMWMYRWTLSLVYVSGVFPAVMLIIAWILSVLLVGWILRTRLVKDGDSTTRESTSSQRRNSLLTMTKEDDSDRATIGHLEQAPFIRSYMLRSGSLLFRALINCVVVMTVHVVFVYLSASAGFTPGANLVAQFSLGFFMLVWNNVAVPELILKSDPNMFVWDKLSIRVLMLLFNTIVVPCIATAFTRPSCFQYVLTPPEKISASYSYTECGFAIINETTGEDKCVVPDDITIDLQPAEPPLIYNFQCGSELLTDYIPVYIYSYSFLILLPIARFLWLWYIPLSAFPGESSWTFFVPTGIMFPDSWNSLPADLCGQHTSEGLATADENSIRPSSSSSPLHITSSPSTPAASSDCDIFSTARRMNATKNNLWNPDSILSRLISHAAILLTFGVCSPVLSFAIVLAVILSIIEWKFVLGRFLFRRFSSLLHYNPMSRRQALQNAEQQPRQSHLLVAVDGVSGYCDVNGEERKFGNDYSLVCLEDSLSGILFSTGRCFAMMVSHTRRF
jgi:hypothetical protein